MGFQNFLIRMSAILYAGIVLLVVAIPIEILTYWSYNGNQFCDKNLNAVTPHPPGTTLHCSGDDGFFDVWGLAIIWPLNTAGIALITADLMGNRKT
jgi:hypothetical protein